MRGETSVLTQCNFVWLTAFFTLDLEVTAATFCEFQCGSDADAEMLGLLFCIALQLG